MGYYVTLEESTFTIPGANLQAAYEAMCELNNHDNLKRGGSWTGSGQTAAWFSWMDANYPDTCSDAKAVLEQLGFTCHYPPDSDDLIVDYYNNKSGQEDLFLKAIAPFVKPGSYMIWRGEEGEMWRWEFDGHSMTTKSPTITWD